MTNSKELQQRIKDKGLRIGWVAEQLELTYQGFWKKLHGKSSFTFAEVWRLKKILELTNNEIDAIFFAEDVDNSSTEGGR